MTDETVTRTLFEQTVRERDEARQAVVDSMRLLGDQRRRIRKLESQLEGREP